MPLNKSCIGKEFAPVTTEVTAAAIQEYARAYNEDNPAFFDAARPGGLVAPPMFAVVVTWSSTLNAVMDPEVSADLLRLVHGEQDMWFLAPIRPGDRITTRARITAIETKTTGETMTIELNAVNQNGVAVNQSVFSAFIRGGGRRTSTQETRTDEDARCQQAPWDHVSSSDRHDFHLLDGSLSRPVHREDVRSLLDVAVRVLGMRFQLPRAAG